MISVSRACRYAGVALAGAVLAACTGDRGEPADTSDAAGTQAAAAGWKSPVHDIPAATIAGALGNAGNWPDKPTEAERHCKGTPACDSHASPAKVKLRVWAEANARNVAFGSVGPTTAVLVGKLKNLGSQTTRTYNLVQGREHAVYVVDSLGTPYYEIWDVHGAGKSRVAAGKVTECGHADRKWNYSFAVFAACATSPTSHLVLAQGDSVYRWANTGAVSHDDGPAWFTCTSGCCTADVQ